VGTVDYEPYLLSSPIRAIRSVLFLSFGFFVPGISLSRSKTTAIQKTQSTESSIYTRGDLVS
jgi:hypothetical protein